MSETYDTDDWERAHKRDHEYRMHRATLRAWIAGIVLGAAALGGLIGAMVKSIDTTAAEGEGFKRGKVHGIMECAREQGPEAP